MQDALPLVDLIFCLRSFRRPRGIASRVPPPVSRASTTFGQQIRHYGHFTRAADFAYPFINSPAAGRSTAGRGTKEAGVTDANAPMRSAQRRRRRQCRHYRPGLGIAAAASFSDRFGPGASATGDVTRSLWWRDRQSAQCILKSYVPFVGVYCQQSS